MSWDQLLDIFKVDAEERSLQASQPPTACPNDGYPLEEGPAGTLHCRFDGWTYPTNQGPQL